jgi:hypothetical protein
MEVSMGELKPTAEIEELARRLAEIEGREVNEAVAGALRAALERRRSTESPSQTAARILKERGIVPSPEAGKPLPREVYHEIEGSV